MRDLFGRLARHRDAGLWLLVSTPPVLGAVLLHGRAALVSAAGVPLLGVAVASRRRWPLAALAIPVALGLALNVEMLAPPYWTALAVLGYLAGDRMTTARPALWFFAAVAVTGLPLCVLLSPDHLWGWPTLLLMLLLFAGLPMLLGRYRRQYAALARAGWRLADRMEREQKTAADRARIRERARIAGDMHDSLGHDLTLLAVRAGALQLDPTLDPRHQAAVAELREAAAGATERLREIIGVLRVDDEQAPGSPPGEGPEALIERARASGVAVTAERLDDLEGLPPMVGLAVHRLVQEALTNSAKHAPGAAVRVRLVRDAGTLRLSVVNAPAAAAPLAGVASGGAGLVGLDERVRLAGGVLRAGPTPDGGFEVAAELPAATGAAPLPAAPYPTTSARELAHAQRQMRRRLAQTVLAPLAVLAGILLLMIPVNLLSSSFSVLHKNTYERLLVGDTRGDVEARLPLFTRDGPPDDAPPAPRGETCVYYSTEFLSAGAYRLCFAGGRLTSKEVVG
ncbi:sensor histidine kinase [Streptosporangium sp. NPDC000396]|uniref:sensor histidine kinase n=1 Tax=Streptosporangium sp. NPDC000396 TaxID=3366185 RepID=UPI0036AC43F5